MHVGL